MHKSALNPIPGTLIPKPLHNCPRTTVNRRILSLKQTFGRRPGSLPKPPSRRRSPKTEARRGLFDQNRSVSSDRKMRNPTLRWFHASTCGCLLKFRSYSVEIRLSLSVIAAVLHSHRIRSLVRRSSSCTRRRRLGTRLSETPAT